MLRFPGQPADVTTPCPSRDALSDLTLGRLTLDQIEAISTHVEDCSTCQAAMETMDGLEDSIVVSIKMAGSVATPDPDLAEAIEEAEAIGSRVWGNVAAEFDEPPATLGQYELLELISRGGMGTVYKALHTRLKRPVALKVLRTRRLPRPESVTRFQREIEAVGRLDHPHIVRAHDAGEAEGCHFLVMELLDGSDLSRLVRSHGPLPVADACEIVRQAALGLQRAHEFGLVHRDIKPSNLMLTTEGVVKVLDLGLARLIEGTALTEEVTSTDQVVGTGDFIAPEQGQDTRMADARSDIYSLGCTLYFLLVGRAPFADPAHNTFVRKVMAHSREPFPPIHTIRNDIPAEVTAVLERMLSKQPSERFQTAAEVADALARFSDVADLSALFNGEGGEPCRTAAAHERLRGRVDVPLSTGVNRRRLRSIVGGVILVTAAIVTLFAGTALVRHLQSVGHSDEGNADPADFNRQGSVLLAAQVELSQQNSAEDAASQAAAQYLTRADLAPAVRDAMVAVLRQHPGESRWAGRNGGDLFAIAVKPLPRGKARQQATPGLLSLTHMQAVQELLKAKSLLDRFAESGLTDATTLRQAVVQAAGRLEVTGEAQGVQHQASVQEGFAVAYVLADEARLSAHLLQPTELGRVRTAYRELMHNQARELMKRSNWKDALVFWHHLHTRKLVSPELYLDAARCFKALGQDADTVRVLAEAVKSLEASASPEFLEQAGDLALEVESDAGQALAESAYRMASERLREQISQPGTRLLGNED